MGTIKAEKDIINSIFNLTKSIIDKYKIRTPGSSDSISAADALSKTMENYCDEVCKEPFIMHPGSLFNVGKIIGSVYILSVLLLLLGGIFIYISLGLCIIAFFYAFIHYFLYGKSFDRFFRKQTGCNTIGILEPAGGVKRQVIVVGHHDSARIFSFFSRFERLAGIRLLLAILFFVFITIISIISSLNLIFYRTVSGLNGASLILTFSGLIFIIPLIFFISNKSSPGAGDNLNGSSIAVHVGKYFADRRGKGMPLNNTRLIILSTDGEEAGQRGAIDFANRHIKELKEIPTFVLNIDSVYKKKYLAVLYRDRHGLVPLSSPLDDECAKTASDLGYDLKRITFPFGSGTDAAAFAKIGVDSTTLIGMPTSLFGKGHMYHTINDTIECIEPEAVEAVFNIAINSICSIDD